MALALVLRASRRDLPAVFLRAEDRLDVGVLRLVVHLAVDETVILLHPPLPLVGVSIVMERERQQNDSLVNG